jgi:hypothetical protein
MTLEQMFMQMGTWLVIILGWSIVNRQNNQREKRKEVRTLIDKVQELLNKIEIDAISYHTQVSNTEELAFQLKRNLNQTLRDKLEILEIRQIDVSHCRNLHKELRKAVTLNNFDTANFQAQILSSSIIRGISLTKDRLSQELEKRFAQQYKD